MPFHKSQPSSFKPASLGRSCFQPRAFSPRLPPGRRRLATMQHQSTSRPRKHPRDAVLPSKPRASPVGRDVMFPNILDMGRRRRVPLRQVPDTFRIFNIEFPERNKIREKIEDVYTPKKKQQRYTLEWRNNPHPIHVKCIKTNTRYFNEPILYMDTEDRKTKQDHWWPRGEPLIQHPKPPYDKQSTQRNDFQKPNCLLAQPVKYHSKMQPSCGIVPLTSPRPPGSLPRLFQEQLTFKQHYDARATPCIPYQGKKCGAFVWTEIKPEMKTAVVPEGTLTPLRPAQGSAPEEHPKTKEGDTANSSTTSDCISSPVSQEILPDSNMALSKPDVMAGTEPALHIPEKGQRSSEVFQTDKVDVSSLPRERTFS